MKGTKLASDIKYYLDYSKWDDKVGKVENWEQSVNRVMNMHRNNPKFSKAFKNDEFIKLFDIAEKAYQEKLVLGSQRALQFGGDPIMKHNARMFNCLNSHCDRVAFFQEAMYWLMNGCGVGFSVQQRHIEKLPTIKQRSTETKTFSIPDSIEGWADAFGVLISSFVSSNGTFSEYQGYKVIFDYSHIRPKGAYINGGFKAPGSEGLRKSLEKCESLLLNEVKNENETKIRPILAYDFVMHMADAVLSGGVRRSATICLFSLEDQEMMKAKTGNWFGENPQRARSNNSVVLHREDCTKKQFKEVFESIKEFGEPGFYFVDDYEQGTNPCVEIGMYPYTEDGRSGWQGCNLTTINGGKITDLEKFKIACTASAVLGTLQASYTDFKYVSKESKEIFDREALLGCSITGWMNNPNILLDEENMRIGAELIKSVNKKVAKIIGINQAARTTCVKPEGNASVLLETSSGCHGDHSPQYFRTIQVNKNSEVGRFLLETTPELIEDSIWSSTNSDYVVFIPVTAKRGSIFKADLLGTKLLENVKKIQQNWVEYGTNQELCVKPYLRHNVSNTIDVENWDEVGDYVWENRKIFSGISFLYYIGDRVFYQAPFTSVNSGEEILEKYGEASFLASGLIVDGLHVFENIYKACDHVTNRALVLDGSRQQVLLKKDWIRRVKQFSRRYFKYNLVETITCLKDVYWLHKWLTINRILSNKEIDLSQVNLTPDYTDIDTLGAIACAGGQCEIPQIITK